MTAITRTTNRIFTRLTIPIVGLLVLSFLVSVPGTARPSMARSLDGQTQQAQQSQGSGGHATPIEKLLNADGTLNLSAGFTGSVDPTGWQVTTTGPSGQPRFVPEGAVTDERGRLTEAGPASGPGPLAPGDENWDDRFLLSGVDGVVNAVAISGINNVYIGGHFTHAGGVLANNIARWDSIANQWYPVGSGVGNGADDRVYAIAISGSDVYVGGHFTTAGGVNANGIARWDSAGSRWYSVGSNRSNGVNDSVYTIAISRNNVYVGGNFTTAGDTIVNRIARWDTTSNQWYPLGSNGNMGVTSDVNAIAISGDNVYVGGAFTAAGGGNASYIARWNGNQWNALGSGVNNGTNGIVWALGVIGDKVYMGGSFTLAGGVSANNLAQWDGARLSPLGSGTNNGVGSSVYAIVPSADKLYVGGFFTTAGGSSANHIVRWNGGQWDTLGSGVNNTVYSLAANIPEVYVGGAFSMAGNKTSTDFGVWQPCPAYFTDVRFGDYYYQSSRALRCMGIVSGYSDRTFRPDDSTSRGQMSKLIVLARGWTLACPATGHFTDVTANNVFYCAIETAYEHRIVSGYDDNTFRPSENVTRGQLSKIIVAAMGWNLYCPAHGQFSDVTSDFVFYCAIETAFAHDAVSGYSDGTFQPNNDASRAQISKIVYQAIAYP